MEYILAPFIAWFTAGIIKFIVNYLRFGTEAKQKIGYGGFPSNHTTIMFTSVMLIGFKQGFLTPLFGLALAVTFIVIIDATGLRRHVGHHAEKVNQLLSQKVENVVLRESIGHSWFEVLGGLVLGTILGFILSSLS